MISKVLYFFNIHNNLSRYNREKNPRDKYLKKSINQTYPGYSIYKLVYALLNDTIN